MVNLTLPHSQHTSYSRFAPRLVYEQSRRDVCRIATASWYGKEPERPQRILAHTSAFEEGTFDLKEVAETSRRGLL